MYNFDGKKVVFIGNSFVYYGGCVEPGNQRRPNNGIFKKLCASMGENVTVYNCTYGGHRLLDFTEEGCKFEKKCLGTPCFGSDLLRDLDLDDIDVVFISEAGYNNVNFVQDTKNIIARFKNPKTEFVYLVHTYTHYHKHDHVLDGLEVLRKEGVKIADWGLVCYRLTERDQNPDAYFYGHDTFIKNKGDRFHPNPLSGYITALTAYAAVTGRSVVGMPRQFCNTILFPADSHGFDGFIDNHYENRSDTNFTKIFSDDAEMKKIQALVDLVVKETV